MSVLGSGVALADTELKNDSFTDGDTVAFQAGFVIGEIGGARFVAPEAGRALKRVQLLFGGGADGVTRTVTLHVWDDTDGAANPGAELFSGDFDLVSSTSALQEFDLGSVVVTQQFRVGIEFQHNGVPAIAADVDGLTANRNFIFAQGLGWASSGTFGVSGDWIIRAVIEDDGPGPGTPDASTGPGPGTPDAAPTTGGECDGNSDCPVGEYCDTANEVCTFDCREDTDCGAGSCNSLGQCVEGGGGGGGCSTGGAGGSGAGGAGGAIALFAAIGALVLGSGRRAKRRSRG